MAKDTGNGVSWTVRGLQLQWIVSPGKGTLDTKTLTLSHRCAGA